MAHRVVELISEALLVMSLALYDSCAVVNADTPGYTLYREAAFMSQQTGSSGERF